MAHFDQMTHALSNGEKLRMHCAVWATVCDVKCGMRTSLRSPYLHVHEADEALDCFPYSLLHHSRARSTQVRHIAALAQPGVAIDECWSEIAAHHLMPKVRCQTVAVISCAHISASVRVMIWPGSSIHTAHTTRNLGNAPQSPANFLLANASFVRADRHADLRAVQLPIGWSDNRSFE
jgi:hypothetical protein